MLDAPTGCVDRVRRDRRIARLVGGSDLFGGVMNFGIFAPWSASVLAPRRVGSVLAPRWGGSRLKDGKRNPKFVEIFALR
ncbi:hypothetical protein N9D38_06530 [Rubripirellula sp.]|nr:hypothetical protein [Rubripirellula sp.]